MEFKIIDTKKRRAQENMQIDAEILAALDREEVPVLHLYEWVKPSITYGYFTRPEDFLDLNEVKSHGIDLAKRVTGGGLTLHFSDFAFSFFIPKGHPGFTLNTLESYSRVNELVKRAVHPFIENSNPDFLLKEKETHQKVTRNFCMAKPTRYDVMIGDKKIGGAAQRRTSKGILHHGTIAIALPDRALLNRILKDQEVIISAIYENSFYFVKNHLEHQKLESYRQLIKKELLEVLQKQTFEAS